uniref:Uncharacterized protein n=1 Tax=Arcella intermedia TaxID=1963864 RepID=A0A6B2LJF1_9EUKA
MQQVKCVVVGDDGVGKTCLLCVYTSNFFPTEYVPPIMENYSGNLVLNQQIINLTLWDTRGNESFDALRPLSYAHTDVWLVVFSVVSPSSFSRIVTQWAAEVSHFSPDAPVILVGTKVDLRDDPDVVAQLEKKGDGPVSYEKGLELSCEIKAVKYLECSALLRVGVREVFEEAIRAVLQAAPQRPEHKRGGCILL